MANAMALLIVVSILFFIVWTGKLIFTVPAEGQGPSSEKKRLADATGKFSAWARQNPDAFLTEYMSIFGRTNPALMVKTETEEKYVKSKLLPNIERCISEYVARMRTVYFAPGVGFIRMEGRHSQLFMSTMR